MDNFLQEALNSPIKTAERANKIYLPLGKKKSAPKTEEEKAATLARGRLAREHQKREASRKLTAMLDYYATTSVPFERVAVHCRMKEDQVAKEMAARGRTL